MSCNKPPKPRPVVPLEPETPLDFDPAQRLRDALASRPVEQGITIDPRGTRIIDDGLWIRSLNTGWVIKTSIADVPSIIPDNSIIEQVARARREDRDIERRRVQRMFPETFLDRYVSLHEGKERPAITFRIELDKDFSIKKYRIFRSAFTSIKQCDREPLRAQLDRSVDVGAFKEVARGLSRARINALAHQADEKINGNALMPKFPMMGNLREEGLASTLIHEVMLLTNTVAGEFFKARKQLAPSKIRGIHIHETSVTNNFEFDQVCNRLCWRVVNHLDQKSDYSRLTSPMRNFRDYVTMKVLSRLLSNQPVEQELRHDILGCTEIFNKAKDRSSETAMTSSRWRNNWGILLTEQTHGHPFNRAHQCRGGTITGNLDNLCRQNKWSRPIVAERTLIFQGTELYFAGMNFHPPQGGSDKQSWAVARDPDMALEMASHRMLQILKPVAKKPSDPSNPGPA